MGSENTTDQLTRAYLAELLVGGFAPTVILLREFQYDKAGQILNGLHFSGWILLGHMRARQNTLLSFMKDPENNQDIWPDAHWPENYAPASADEWEKAIAEFEKELNEMIDLVKNPEIDLFQVQSNGKTLAWAAMTTLHHNGYHIGQLKTIGRQLGVW
ncbi:hypothetical protein [Adhaeribacter aquaticus]|uniref:hypothetical protein n=1 Tax=Adhaeribacter aquaticus TaxID=299567 RepID=UPI0003F731B7|nr:hypothetical protein [Adhaeribacter aquaticus]